MGLPKRDRRLPSVLSENEVEQVIGDRRPKDNERAGWRDPCLVETLYSCGLRAGEVVARNWSDIDAEMAMVQIRHGKGDKFCLVPIGEVALDALDRWHRLTRSNGSSQPIFINFRGGSAPNVARPSAHRQATGRT